MQEVACELAAQPGSGYTKAHMRRLYQQAGRMGDLYGAVEGERWQDGLATSALRAAAGSNEATWLVWDGPADSAVLEGMTMVRLIQGLLVACTVM